MLIGIAVGLVAGIFEELGWTGFAVPTLLRLGYGVLGTGLIVGVLWGAWHLPINFWGSGVTSEELSLAIFLPAWLLGILVGSLTAYRVLIVWVYERTNGSLLLAILMHVSLATFTFILTPPLGPRPAVRRGVCSTSYRQQVDSFAGADPQPPPGFSSEPRYEAAS